MERPDSTAWACLAVLDDENQKALLQQGRNFLAARQKDDGRVCLMQDTPDVYWPTALAILAWTGSKAHRKAGKLAVDFLLNNSGNHPPKAPDAATTHDTSLRGWPWVDKTHSWVEPTALAILALVQRGFSRHDRVTEAVRMLLDRQLPTGGWNYGNTAVFGKVLDPLPESTGIALAALAGRVSRAAVTKSLSYLSHRTTTLRTPLSLAWSILALDAWHQRPKAADAWLEECFALQAELGAYDTECLSLWYLAACASPKWLLGADAP